MEEILKHLYFSTVHHTLLKVIVSRDVDILEDGVLFLKDRMPSDHSQCVLFWAAGGWNVINDFSSHGTLSHSQCISSEVTNPTVPGIQAIGMDTFNESMAKWYSNSFLRLPDQGPTGNCPSE